MPKLSDKLKSLGVKVGVEQIATPLPKSKENLFTILGGSLVDTPFGQVFIVDSHNPSEHLQTQYSLHISMQLNGISAWIKIPEIARLSINSIAFIDTETTGLSGGTGTFAFLIGLGRFENENFTLKQLFLREPLEEPGLLYLLEQLLAPCQAVVTFNGKSFDLPILNSRYILHGWQSPFPDLYHIDLLHLARQLWRDRLSSRTLSSLEIQILNTVRTQEDVPGWMIPQLYFDYLRSGDAMPLKKVFYHNAMDVLSLASLLDHTAKVMTDPFTYKPDHGEDIIALAKLYEKIGDIETASNLYLQGLQTTLPQPLYLNTLHRFAYLNKRARKLDAAIELWKTAAEHNFLDAIIELAKYYEHKMQNYGEAIHWTKSAIKVINSSSLLPDKLDPVRMQLEHRLNRLLRKNRGE